MIKGKVSVKDACFEYFHSGKTTPKPSTGLRSESNAVSNVVIPGFLRGAPGQAVKPRVVPPDK